MMICCENISNLNDEDFYEFIDITKEICEIY